MKIRLHNPPQRKRSSRRGRSKTRRRAPNYTVVQRRHNKNYGGGELITMANRRKKKSHRRKRYGRKRRRRNPTVHAASNRGYRGRKRGYRRRRNPNGRIMDITTTAGWAIAGGVLTKTVTGLVLRANNVGVVGYLGNGVVAVAASMAASRWFSKKAGDAILLGGAVMIAGRLVEDFFGYQAVQFGQLPGLSGEFIPQAYPVPYSSLPQVQRAGILPPPEVAAAAAGSSMSGPWNGSPWN